MSSQSSSSPQESTDSEATWKRKYLVLEAEHRNAFGTGRVKSLAETQVSLGRCLKRAVDMFRAPRELVEESDRRTELLLSGSTEDSSAEENAVWQSYEALIKHVPIIKTLVAEGDTLALEALYVNLRKGSDAARGDDACNLKSAVVTWINEEHGPSVPHLKGDSKTERGLENDHTGRLLCPAEFDWDNLRVRTNIRDGHVDFAVTAGSWPAFCYSKAERYSPTDIEKGLFRGELLVKTFKYIFLSPSSLTDDSAAESPHEPSSYKRVKINRPSTRSSVATLIGLRTVTPRSIAYVAIQVQFALSSAGSWRLTDGEFDNIDFYNEIVSYFDMTPGVRAKTHVDALLEWWNVQVFGVHMSKNRQGRHASTTVSKLAAQRKAQEEEIV